MTANDSSPQNSARAPWRLVLLLGAVIAFPAISTDLYLPALPTLAGDLGASVETAQQTVSAFFAGMAVGQLFYGSASDRLGRRGPLLAGIALYIVASVACALATSMPMLLAGRVLQALGACSGVVITRAVVRDRFGHHQAAQVLSQLMLVMGLAPILAPMCGGLLLQAAGWRSIFWVLVAFGVIVGGAVALTLPESRSAETAAQARAESPVRAYLALLRQKRLLGYLLGGCLNSACLFTYITVSPGLLIGHYGVPASQFGWYFGANAAGLVGASQLNRYLLRRYSPDQVLMVIGVIALVAAFVLALTSYTGLGGMWGVLPPLFFALASYGVMSGNTGAGALSVDPHRAGSVSALMGASSFAAGAIVSAIAAQFHDGGPRSMATVFVICMTGSMLAIRLLALPRGAKAAA
ncbi:MAG: Bcr/CflA family drug resistance efflux transporter [Caulobacterales bacterium 68-7]|nr:multidrug effflux MFS transporter [Caulobacterales bacterium]OJU13601.1 MAG: Bcr/CflA family drug resistance efflux transporter [Caulobacterales bacterium 68-7]